MPEQLFKYFYDKAKLKADEALKAVDDEKLNKEKLRRNAVDYLYRNFPKNEKQIFEYIAVLDEEKKKLLGTEKQAVKLSVENMAKNIINHPEITLKEYYLIQEIVDKTELLIYIHPIDEQPEKILCFAKNDKYYEAVIKTTGDKKENYLQSFHVTDPEGVEREKKKKNVKVIYDKLTPKQTVCREDSLIPSVGI